MYYFSQIDKYLVITKYQSNALEHFKIRPRNNLVHQITPYP